MFRFKRSLLAISLATVSYAPTSFAAAGTKTLPEVQEAPQGQQKPSIGFWGGYAQTESRRDATTFGADYMFQPVIPFSFGGEVLGWVSHRGDRASTLTRTRLLAKAQYNFGGTFPIIKDTYLSLGLGPVFDNETNTTDVALGIVPSIGMDFPLPSWFTNWSLGANFGYTFLTAGNQTFTANGVLKYWF